MSAVKKPFLLRRKVHNPALGVPRVEPRVPKAVRLALLDARQPVCAACRFYVLRDGQDRCVHIDRSCERLKLGKPKERCPINAWRETT